jgi:hypothetical protein
MRDRISSSAAAGSSGAGRQLEHVLCRRLRARPTGVHGRLVAVDDVVVERVLHVRPGVRGSPQPLGVRLVLGEQQRWITDAAEHHVAQLGMLSTDGDGARRSVQGLQETLRSTEPPGVAEPHRRKEVHRRRLLAPVGDRDPDVHVLRRCLRVFDVDVDVMVPCEGTGVDQLVLRLETAPGTVRRHEVVVRVRGERIAVPVLEVRARGGGVDVVVVLLDVLAVVAFGVREPEHPLLQDGIGAVPQREAEAEMLVIVAEPGDAVLAPLVGPGTRLVMGEVAPRVAVVAVVLPHGAPLALTHVRSPSLPRHALARLRQTIGLGPLRHPVPRFLRAMTN